MKDLKKKQKKYSTFKMTKMKIYKYDHIVTFCLGNRHIIKFIGNFNFIIRRNQTRRYQSFYTSDITIL
jgi:hypothetical protein